MESITSVLSYVGQACIFSKVPFMRFLHPLQGTEWRIFGDGPTDLKLMIQMEKKYYVL